MLTIVKVKGVPPELVSRIHAEADKIRQTWTETRNTDQAVLKMQSGVEKVLAEKIKEYLAQQMEQEEGDIAYSKQFSHSETREKNILFHERRAEFLKSFDCAIPTKAVWDGSHVAAEVVRSEMQKKEYSLEVKIAAVDTFEIVFDEAGFKERYTRADEKDRLMIHEIKREIDVIMKRTETGFGIVVSANIFSTLYKLLGLGCVSQSEIATIEVG